MLYGRYIFSCTFNDEAVLPEYKGSTFRGVFGHALKKVVCALRREDCHGCLLQNRCVYALVFEKPPPSAAEKTRIIARPHPYVIEPDPAPQTRYQPGETFSFTLLLFGLANDFLPYFVYAFDQIGQSGIGKRIDGKRATFLLSAVYSGGHAVYTSEKRCIREGTFTDEASALAPTGIKSPGPFTALEMTLQTPLRLKYENHLKVTLPFHVLVRTVLRRISALEAAYGEGEPPLDYRGLVARARDVQIRSSTLRWFDWQRYSNRQDQAMLMGGMIGKISYEGDMTEYIPLLRYCEKVHLGKQTTFGLGKYSLHLPRQ